MPSLQSKPKFGDDFAPRPSFNDCTFDFAGFRIRVTCDDRAALEWLTEFLSPNFATTSDGPPDCTVAAFSDADRHANRRASVGESKPYLAACFDKDTGTTRLPCWDLPDARRLVHDDGFKVTYLLDPNGREVEVAGRAPSPGFRIALMRAVRELAMNHASKCGHVLVHGAAFSIGCQGIACIGPKEAGKTTFLMAALMAMDSGFVANDRLAVRGTSAGVLALGVPTIVSIRRPSLANRPAIQSELRQRPYRHAHTLTETLAADAANALPTDLDRISISPSQFCHLIGTQRIDRTQLSAVVFPRIDASITTSTLRRLNPNEAAEKMPAGLFRATQPTGLESAFALFIATLGGSKSDRVTSCTTIVDSTACYECAVGGDVLADPSRAGSLIESMVGKKF